MRLEDTYGNERNNYNDLKLENQQLRDNIEKLQVRLTEALTPKKVSLLDLIRRFLTSNRVKKQQDNSEQE